MQVVQHLSRRKAYGITWEARHLPVQYATSGFVCCRQCLCACHPAQAFLKNHTHILKHAYLSNQTKSNADHLKGQRPAGEPCRLRELLLKHSLSARRKRHAQEKVGCICQRHDRPSLADTSSKFRNSFSTISILCWRRWLPRSLFASRKTTVYALVRTVQVEHEAA